MYHKVDIVTPSKWWVSVESFHVQIVQIIDAGFQFVYLDDYDYQTDRQVVLTFDDAYENVYRHAFPLLAKQRLPFEMFLMGDLLGGWNHFDRHEMRTRICSLGQLNTMAQRGGRMQWHTRNHSPLPQLGDSELEFQLTVNSELKAAFPEPHFQWFAYPSGMHDERSVRWVREKFRGALSVDDGSSADGYQLNRVTVDDEWRIN